MESCILDGTGHQELTLLDVIPEDFWRNRMVTWLLMPWFFTPRKGLKLGTPLRDWTIRENVNIFCVSPNKFNINVVNMCISVFLPSNIFICCITVFLLTDPQWYSTRNLLRTINVGIFYDMITIINPHCNPIWSYKRLLMVSYKGNISHIFWRTLLSKAT